MLRLRCCLPAVFLALSSPAIAREDAAPGPYEGHALVRVELKNAQQVKLMETISLDCWCEGVRVGVFDFRVLPEKMDALKLSGLRFEVITENLQPRVDAEATRIEQHNRQDGGDWYAEYKNADQILARVNALVDAHPDVATLIDIGDSTQGRDVWAVRVTGGNGDTPSILFNSCQHAREWISPMTTVYILENLLDGYGDDDRITALVNSTEFFIIPLVNPDGYRYSWDSFRFWRKNRRNNGGGSWGVDLNRNWGVEWGGGGSSGNPDSDTYHGTGPFSEPETQAMRDFYEAHPNITASIDFHSSGQYVLYPWAYQPGGPDDDSEHVYLSGEMVDAIRSVHNAPYQPGPVFETLYQASGASVDWTWGDQDVLSWTIELRGPGFDPPPSTIRPNVEENFEAALTLAGLRGGLPSVCFGDLDLDGVVDFSDLLRVLAAWGSEGGPEDLDKSGLVDFDDLLVVLAAWGPCPARGACCLPDGTCSEVSADDCGDAGGFFAGAGARCGPGRCTPVDDCEDAPIAVDGIHPFSTVGTSDDGPSLPPECDEGNGRTFRRDVWIRYLASCTGIATASVCESDYNTRLAVYERDACPGAIIACSDDACGENGTRSETTFPVVAGEEYLVRIGGRASTGSGTLVLSCAALTSPSSQGR